MKIKRYSMAVHALHSRLQLIRGKLHIEKGMSPNDFVAWNEKYLNKAAESVQLQHDVHCGRTEFHETAELFMISIVGESEILNQPLWDAKRK